MLNVRIVIAKKYLKYFAAITMLLSLSVLAPAHAQDDTSNKPVYKLEHVTRGFIFSYANPDWDNSDALKFYSKGDKSLEDFGKYIKRDNINFIIGAVNGDRPNFDRLNISVAVAGSIQKMKNQFGFGAKYNSKSADLRFGPSIDQPFISTLIRGKPVTIDEDGVGQFFAGPVYKRAIILRRSGNKNASPQIIKSELMDFANKIASESRGDYKRIMLYSMKGNSKNWPTRSFPKYTDVKRSFDAVIMIWPKKGHILPRYLYGVPSNYKIMYDLYLAGYYYTKGPSRSVNNSPRN